jgi:hypothetical protein
MAKIGQSHEKLAMAEFGNMEKERNLLTEEKRNRKQKRTSRKEEKKRLE